MVSLAVSVDNGKSWERSIRKEYNFFEREKSGGFGADRVMVRVTCSNGNSVVVPDVDMASGAKTAAPVNC